MKKIYLILFICLFLLLSGCNSSKTTNINSNTVGVESFGTDWQQTGFQLKSAVGEEYMDALTSPPFHEIYRLELAKESWDAVSSCQGDILYLWQNASKEGETSVLQSHDVSEGTVAQKEVCLPEGIGAGHAVAMDVWHSRIAVLYMETGLSRLWVLILDTECNVMDTFVLEAFPEQGETPVSIYDFYMDAQGYCYLLAGDYETRDVLYVFDKEGKYLFSENCTSAEVKKECSGFHTPDGSVILQIPGQLPEPPVLVWYDMSKEQSVEMVKLDVADDFTMSMGADGKIYMMMTSKLMRWDVTTGKQEPLFNFLKSDIRTNNIKELGVTPEGEVFLYSHVQGTWEVYKLSDEVVETDEDTIVLANIGEDIVTVEKQAVAFSGKFPERKIIVEGNEAEKGAYRDRIMAQLASGKGPDLLWVSREDMEILQNKGLLLDLRQLISEETLGNIFPGVIASGTIEDTLYGMFFDGYPSGYLVSNEIWPRDSWTVDDICNFLAEENSLLSVAYKQNEYSLNILFEDVYSLPFVDGENGESHFEDTRFIQLLKYIKKYNGKLDDDKDTYCMVKDGEILYETAPLFSLRSFSALMSECGESCHLIGYLNNDSTPGFWSNTNFLVVNKNTGHKEDISAFLEYLLGKETQEATYACSVRPDIIRDSVFSYVGLLSGKTFVSQRKGDGVSHELVVKEDGTSYVEEYIDYLSKCGPCPPSGDKIREIVWDVAAGYFNGQYTAEHTAELIDNRVQLYLDEQK